MKKILSLALIGIMIGILATGCAPQKSEAPVPTAKWVDGKYFAAADSFDEKSGWKSIITLEVKENKIVAVDWNGVSKKGGDLKKVASMNGKYPMVEKGGAKAPWHEQALAMETFLIEKQDPAAVTLKDDGKTDVVASVSITVSDFAVLSDKALKAGPTTVGPYKDGPYHSELAAFNEKTGWKDMVDITVANGNIMAVNWNGVHKDGGDDKKTSSVNGKYPMVEKGGAKAPWHEQAAAAENFLLEKQDVAAITLKDDGKTDAIASVSITVSEFAQLVTEALSAAK